MLTTVSVVLLLFATAQDPRAATHAIAPAARPIAIDGVIDPDEWSGVVPIELPFETSPGRNTPAPVRTEALLAYGEGTIYVAFRAWDPDMGAVRAHLTDRDRAFDDDFAGIVLDTFNDQRRAFEFFANPLGVQMDRANADVDGVEDDGWDAIWDSAGRILGDRWEVEMAIPFRALRFAPGNGSQTWGFDLVRFRPRDRGTRIALGRLDPDRSCYVCQLPKLTGLTGLRAGKNIELAPTVTATQTERFTADPGLTAQWGITPNVVFSAALNPDFSHIEADAPRIDVNQTFTLSFAEKRPFFLEGSDFFRTPIQAVYTRTISDPRWGAKLTGKEGRSGGGAFVAADAVTGLVIPSADRSSRTTIPGEHLAAVLRYRYDLGRGSTAGVLFTSRSGDAYANQVAGVDGFFRLGESDTVSAQVLVSRTEYPEAVSRAFAQPAGVFHDVAGSVRYDHRSRNYYWSASYDHTGTGFRADAGFVPQVDLRHADAALQRTWWPVKHPFFSRFWIGAEWDLARKQNGVLLEDEREAWAGFDGPRQSEVQLVVGQRKRSYLETEFGPERTLDLAARAEPHKRLLVELDLNAGDTIDFANARPATRVRIAPLLRIRATRSLEVDLATARERLDVSGGRLFRASVGEVRAVYQLSLRSFVRVVAQYEDVERNRQLYREPVPARSRRLLPQILFSYKLNPQTVVFAGYSSTWIADDRGVDARERNRTFFLKIGYAWLL